MCVARLLRVDAIERTPTHVGCLNQMGMCVAQYCCASTPWRARPYRLLESDGNVHVRCTIAARRRRRCGHAGCLNQVGRCASRSESDGDLTLSLLIDKLLLVPLDLCTIAGTSIKEGASALVAQQTHRCEQRHGRGKVTIQNSARIQSSTMFGGCVCYM